jgi:hypothetical protein
MFGNQYKYFVINTEKKFANTVSGQGITSAVNLGP